MRLNGFPIIIDKNTQVLIMGTFPSKTALSLGQYFAFKGNQFWTILSGILDEDLVGMDYEKRLKTILRHGIGIYDVLEECERSTSADADIINEKYADLPGIARQHPSLRKFVFAGKFLLCRKEGRQVLDSLDGIIPYEFVPSPSPRYPMPIDEKTGLWRKAILG